MERILSSNLERLERSRTGGHSVRVIWTDWGRLDPLSEPFGASGGTWKFCPSDLERLRTPGHSLRLLRDIWTLYSSDLARSKSPGAVCPRNSEARIQLWAARVQGLGARVQDSAALRVWAPGFRIWAIDFKVWVLSSGSGCKRSGFGRERTGIGR